MYNRSNSLGKDVLPPKTQNQASNERSRNFSKLDPKAHLKHWSFAQLFLTLVALTLLLLPSLSWAAQVTLQWDGVSPVPDGYRLYRRTASSSYNYSSPAWSGSARNCTLQVANDTTYYYVARSYKGSLQSVNSNEVRVYVPSNSVDPVPAPTPSPTPTTQVTINNSTSRTSSTGKWQTSQASGNYSTLSLYSEEVGAEYSFKTYLTGLYELNLWWTSNDTRCSDVPVEVYNNNELLDVLTINQQQNGGKWNTFGTYNFSGSAQVTFVSGHSECVTSVDSVSFKPVQSQTQDKIIDNTSSQCYSTGSWLASSGPNPYGQNSFYGETPGGSFTFDSSNTGGIGVSLWWTSLTSRSSRVPVDIFDGSTRLNRIYVNQQQNGGKWNSLGQYSFTRGARVVIVSEGGTVNSCADAVKLSFGTSTAPAPAPAPASSIIDNGSSQCSSIGPWLVSSGPNPYGKNSLYGETAGGSYTFNSSNTGRMDVSLWWTSLSTRSSRAPVDIYDGSTRLNRVYVNQQQNGGKWNSLGQYSFTKGARVVIVSEGGSYNSCADAVKLQAN